MKRELFYFVFFFLLCLLRIKALVVIEILKVGEMGKGIVKTEKRHVSTEVVDTIQNYPSL